MWRQKKYSSFREFLLNLKALDIKSLGKIDKLLSTDNAAPLVFENADKYIEYLADIEQPVLPWETKPELVKITERLSRDVQDYVADLKSKAITVPVFGFQKIENLSADRLKTHIEELGKPP